MVKAMTTVFFLLICFVFLRIDEGLGLAIHRKIPNTGRALPVSAVSNFIA